MQAFGVADSTVARVFPVFVVVVVWSLLVCDAATAGAWRRRSAANVRRAVRPRESRFSRVFSLREHAELHRRFAQVELDVAADRTARASRAVLSLTRDRVYLAGLDVDDTDLHLRFDDGTRLVLHRADAKEATSVLARSLGSSLGVCLADVVADGDHVEVCFLAPDWTLRVAGRELAVA